MVLEINSMSNDGSNFHEAKPSEISCITSAINPYYLATILLSDNRDLSCATGLLQPITLVLALFTPMVLGIIPHFFRTVIYVAIVLYILYMGTVTTKNALLKILVFKNSMGHNISQKAPIL